MGEYCDDDEDTDPPLSPFARHLRDVLNKDYAFWTAHELPLSSQYRQKLFSAQELSSRCLSWPATTLALRFYNTCPNPCTASCWSMLDTSTFNDKWELKLKDPCPAHPEGISCCNTCVVASRNHKHEIVDTDEKYRRNDYSSVLGPASLPTLITVQKHSPVRCLVTGSYTIDFSLCSRTGATFLRAVCALAAFWPLHAHDHTELLNLES